MYIYPSGHTIIAIIPSQKQINYYSNNKGQRLSYRDELKVRTYGLLDSLSGGLFSDARKLYSFVNKTPYTDWSKHPIYEEGSILPTLVLAQNSINKSLNIKSESIIKTVLRKGRPYLRNSTKEAILKNAKTINGQYVDANTGEIIKGKYHFGHKYGHEYYKYKNWAEANGLTQSQFNDLMNNPDLYQIEAASNNVSHMYEAPKDVFLGGK